MGKPTSDIVHTHFSLSYAYYLVLHRTLLQSMPDEWQRRFVDCLEELVDAFRHVPQAEAYDVTPGREVVVNELSDAECAATGVTMGDGEVDASTYYDRDGNELEPWQRVIVPGPEPVPGYNRGRTYIEPCHRHICVRCCEAIEAGAAWSDEGDGPVHEDCP